MVEVGVVEVEEALPDLGQLAVDLDPVDLGLGEVVAVGARRSARGVAEDRDALRRLVERRERIGEVPVPDVAGEIGPGAIERVHRLALVELEQAVAVRLLTTLTYWYSVSVS